MTKVRIYTPFFPYAPSSGAHQVIYEQARGLAAAGEEVELVFWKDAPARVAARLGEPYFKPIHPMLKLSYLPDRAWHGLTAAEWLARGAGMEGAVSESSVARARRSLRSVASGLASPELFFYPPAMDSRVSLEGLADHEIYHYSFAYAWLRKPHGPRVRMRSVVFHNFESELFKLRAHQSAPLERPMHELNRFKLLAHEKALAGLADELRFLSPRDLERYCGKGARLVLDPPRFDPELRAYREGRRAEDARGAVGFIGALGFGPNQDSLAWLLREVCPILEKDGFRGKLRIAGGGAPPELRALAQRYAFVEMMGFVPDAEDFWSRISLLLSPHVSGSGTRIKLLEGLASGLKVMTHPAGLELLANTAEARRSPLLISAESPEAWARVIFLL